MTTHHGIRTSSCSKVAIHFCNLNGHGYGSAEFALPRTESFFDFKPTLALSLPNGHGYGSAEFALPRSESFFDFKPTLALSLPAPPEEFHPWRYWEELYPLSEIGRSNIEPLLNI